MPGCLGTKHFGDLPKGGKTTTSPFCQWLFQGCSERPAAPATASKALREEVGSLKSQDTLFLSARSDPGGQASDAGRSAEKLSADTDEDQIHFSQTIAFNFTLFFPALLRFNSSIKRPSAQHPSQCLDLPFSWAPVV